MNREDVAIRNRLAEAIFGLVKQHRGQLVPDRVIEVGMQTKLTALLTVQATPDSDSRCFVLQLRELM